MTIVQRQLLPLIREKQEWPDEQCVAKTNCQLGSQPVGAMGRELGTSTLQMEIDKTGHNFEIPTRLYILASHCGKVN